MICQIRGDNWLVVWCYPLATSRNQVFAGKANRYFSQAAILLGVGYLKMSTNDIPVSTQISPSRLSHSAVRDFALALMGRADEEVAYSLQSWGIRLFSCPGVLETNTLITAETLLWQVSLTLSSHWPVTNSGKT